MKQFGFGPEEKLKSRKAIAFLFEGGIQGFGYPIKAFYRTQPFSDDAHSTSPRIGVSVSKKKFKRAVDRNRIKRKMREAYRLNKHGFIQAMHNVEADILLVYIAEQEEDFKGIEKGVKKVLKQIAHGRKSN